MQGQAIIFIQATPDYTGYWDKNSFFLINQNILNTFVLVAYQNFGFTGKYVYFMCKY